MGFPKLDMHWCNAKTFVAYYKQESRGDGEMENLDERDTYIV